MNEQILHSRIDFDKLGNNYPTASGVTIEKQVIENIDCYWFTRRGTTDHSKVGIYLHGGCFVFGSVRSHQALVSHLASYLELPILFIEYSLAPEKPYPQAVNDIFNVYRQLHAQYDQSEFIIMGDSAGGWLSMALLPKLNQSGFRPPACNILISPWMDLTCSNNSITQNSKIDPILNRDRLLELAPIFVGNRDLASVNILETVSKDCPPTLIIVGSREILLDDSRQLYNKIIAAQPGSRLSIYEGQTHVWLLDEIDTEASQEALKEMKAFLL